MFNIKHLCFIMSFLILFCLGGVAESDMDLDLLVESDSDSESSHSNQDNASIQRSAVTMATAGSDAGILLCVAK